MNKEQIGLRIKLERTKQNLTQEQLAEMADISSSYLSAIERGKQSISLDYTNRIAEALKIPVIDFLTHEPESRYGMEELEKWFFEVWNGRKACRHGQDGCFKRRTKT